MKKFAFVLAALFGLCLTGSACAGHENQNEPPASYGDGASEMKTLIVYYSFTGNSHTIATELQAQTGADLLRVEPADENVDYNDYSIGLPMMNLIKSHPDDPASYPAIKTTIEDLAQYDVILIAAPLWWNNMAAPLQTFFFEHGKEMAGKHIGLVVSSGESGIAGVEDDVRRLIPDGHHLSPSLWILRSQTGRCKELIAQWLKDISYADITAIAKTAGKEALQLHEQDGQLYAEGTFSRISLYDMCGRLLGHSASATLHTAALPAGTYLVCAENEQGMTARKIRLPLKNRKNRLF